MSATHQVAVVTGANRGIGFELAKQLAEAGYYVYAGMRDPERSAQLLELADRDEARITAVQLDVTVEDHIAAVVERIQDKRARVDVLINNAATFAHDEEGVEQTRAEEMLRVLATNSVAPIMVTRHFLPLLEAAARTDGRPRVVTVSSGAALLKRDLPESGSQYSYHASKAGLNVYLMRLAADLKARGVISIGMAPGFVLTDMTRAADLSPTLLPHESAAGQIKVIERLSLDDAGSFFRYEGEKLDWFVD